MPIIHPSIDRHIAFAGCSYSLDFTDLLVLSVRPKVAELAFHAFSRSLHPELYTIHKTRKIERTNYEARIDITNCGHVITWNAAGATVCEVATSAHQPLPTKRRLLSQPLKGSRTERANCRGGICYKTHFQLEPVEPDLFFMVQQQLGSSPTEGLLHTFDASGRMAMGALERQLAGAVMGRGVALAAVGVVLGLVAAYASAQFIQSLLFGVEARDPLTFVTVPVVLLCVAAAASLIPAVRASRVDPVEALREE